MEKMKIACKKRGQVWTDEHKKQHSQRMLGPSNAMRGKQHTEEFKVRMSALKKQQYRDGTVAIRKNKISRQEKLVGQALEEAGYKVERQFHIHGVPCNYDFFLPEINTIVEYQGDYWHANPSKYKPESVLSIIKVGPCYARDIWKRDARRKKAAETRGFRVVYFWEKEFKKYGATHVLSLL